MAKQILPFYLVCDESGSMSGEPIKSINDALPDLHVAIGSNPVVADRTQFCIIGFSDSAQVLLPLSDLSQVAQMPVLQAQGGTSYGSVLRELRARIDTDLSALKKAGHTVYRPAVFFLTDGFPTDSYFSEYAALTSADYKFRPNIISFGIGSADSKVIERIATFRAFMADGTISPAAALKEFASALTKSIIRTGSSATATGVTLQIPDTVPGFTTLSAPRV